MLGSRHPAVPDHELRTETPAESLEILYLLSTVSTASLAGAHAAMLGPLTEYEHDIGGDLVRTLRTYVATGGNALETARRLGAHRNTILNRLTRINKLLGVDVREPQTLFRIHAALRAGELLSTRNAVTTDAQ